MTRTLSSVNGLLSGCMLVLALAWAAPAPAVDTLLLELGTNEGEEEVDRYGGAVRWDFPFKWLSSGDWHLGSYIELSVTYWDGTRGTEGDDELVDFGLTPVFRYQRDPAHGIAPFIELGLGVHVHTEDGIGDRAIKQGCNFSASMISCMPASAITLPTVQVTCRVAKIRVRSR